MNVLINASAAGEGGALTILERLLDSLEQKDNSNVYYYVISPIKRADTKKVRYIKLHTSGIFTYLFSILGVIIPFLYFSCDKLVSLNNVNFIFNGFYKNKTFVTYFHQLKIFTGTDLRMKLLRKTIKFDDKSDFIVQTKYVKAEFHKCFGSHKQVNVKWPGIGRQVDLPELSLNRQHELKGLFDRSSKSFKNILIWPVMDYDSPHKNFDFFRKNSKYFTDNKIKVVATNSAQDVGDFYFGIGKLTKSELMFVYSLADGIIFVSKLETLGLPIFENLACGKPSFVLDSDYVDGLVDFHFAEGITVFTCDNLDILKHKLMGENHYKSPAIDFIEFYDGNWDFL